MENKDQGIPFSKYPKRVIQQLFPQDKPIFWGPNQNTIFPGTYNEPSGWNPNELLEIPRVLRVFVGSKAGKCSCSSIHCVWELITFLQCKSVRQKYPYIFASLSTDAVLPYDSVPPTPDPYIAPYFGTKWPESFKVFDTSTVDDDGLCRSVVFTGPLISIPSSFAYVGYYNFVSWKKTCSLRYGGGEVFGCDNAFSISYVSLSELGDLQCNRNERIVLDSFSGSYDAYNIPGQEFVSVNMISSTTLPFSDYPTYLPEDCLDDPDPCA